jgi:hypothetical protein
VVATAEVWVASSGCCLPWLCEGEANEGGDVMPAVGPTGAGSDRGEHGIVRSKHTQQPQSKSSPQFYVVRPIHAHALLHVVCEISALVADKRTSSTGAVCPPAGCGLQGGGWVGVRALAALRVLLLSFVLFLCVVVFSKGNMECHLSGSFVAWPRSPKVR